MLRLTLALPFPVALRLDPGLPERQQDCIAELIDCSGKLASTELDFGVLEIRVFDSPELYGPPLCSQWKHPGNVRHYRLVAISVDGSKTLQQLFNEYSISDSPAIRVNAAVSAAEMALEILELDVRNLLLLANVAYPGAISLESGFALLNDTVISRPEGLYTEDFHMAVEAASTANWPHFHKLTIADGWKWLSKSGCIEDGIGVGRLGRAWAALTHISKRSLQQDDSLDLVWILLGLEALYTKGNIGVKDQLVTKTQVLLGERRTHIKAFGAMYDFRSRLLHGDIDIPLRFSPWNATDDFSKYDKDLHSSTALSLAVLIATLQIMANNFWIEPIFTYSVSGKSLNI